MNYKSILQEHFSKLKIITRPLYDDIQLADLQWKCILILPKGETFEGIGFKKVDAHQNASQKALEYLNSTSKIEINQQILNNNNQQILNNHDNDNKIINNNNNNDNKIKNYLKKGLLANIDILFELENKKIIINPFCISQLGPNSYDVTIGKYYYRQISCVCELNPWSKDFNKFWVLFNTEDTNNEISIRPGELIL